MLLVKMTVILALKDNVKSPGEVSRRFITGGSDALREPHNVDYIEENVVQIPFKDPEHDEDQITHWQYEAALAIRASLLLNA